MLQIMWTKKSMDFPVYLLLTTFFLTTLACTHNSSNLVKEPEGLESEIVSTRNPNIVIESPPTFAWLPESTIKPYNHPGLRGFPLHETVQEAIAEYLTRNGYLYKKSNYAGYILVKRKRYGTNIETKDLILIKNWKWAGANFGAGGFLKEITLENRSNKNVKDLRLRIGYLGTRGAKEGYWGPTSIFLIHDVLPAKSVKTFKDINIGFRHPDQRKENMSVLSVRTITDDLLIGYSLVTNNALNDQDINTTYDITSDQSENNARINEYKKGTVIIDVIDSETRILVWRGAIQALTSFYIPEDTKVKRIKLAVEKLASNFITAN